MNHDKMIFESYSPQQTEEIAYSIGKTLKPGEVICLSGELGAGKTAFTRGLVKAFDVKEPVTSPTFTIVNEYDGILPVYHFDVYRINDVEEMFEIGFEEYIYGNGISIIEWPEHIKEILPASYINVTIRKNLDIGEQYRSIEVTKVGE